MTSYAKALVRLDDFSNFEKKAHLLKPVFSLQGISDILSRLGDPHTAFPCVHVAGTVGKGSVCFITEAALRTAGYRTGLYMSPHIRDIRERIRVNGRMISQKDFARMYDAIMSRGLARPDEHTYFEALTAMAFEYFAEQKIQIAVIETGLGGRLDSTNVIPGFVSVITRIGHDHKAVLGGTLRAIATEKAGIIKPGAHLVTLIQNAVVNQTLHDACVKTNASASWAIHNSPPGRIADRIPENFSTNRFYMENLSLSRTVLEVLCDLGFPTTEEHLVKALNTAEFPARMQWRTVTRGRKTVRVLIDAGHNPPAARAMKRELVRQAQGAPVTAVVGMMRDKDAPSFLKTLAPACRAVICARLDAARAWPAEQLATFAGAHCPTVHTAPDVVSALEMAFKSTPANGVIVFTGTFYAIDRVLDWTE